MPSSTTSVLPTSPVAVADTGKIRTGAGFKLLPAKPAAATADAGKIRTGAGFKLFA